MGLYRITEHGLNPIRSTSFSDQGIKERNDLQRFLKDQINALGEDLLVIAEEFSDWEESQRRVDLLAVDRQANIVVIELKRTEDGGHMELQAIRYAAMLSTMTFYQAVQAFSHFLEANGKSDDAEKTLLDFLDWQEPNDDQFAQDVRIILASADFSKELTSSVLWLNERDIDIRCIRMKPYEDAGETLLDIQQVIPLPEATDYQIKVREKQQKERQSRAGGRDFTRYDLTIDGKSHQNLPKRWLVYHVVKAVLASGVPVSEIQNAMNWRKDVFVSFDGTLDSDQFATELMKQDKGGTAPITKRYFCRKEDLIYEGGKTYALTNQWGLRTIKAVDSIISLPVNSVIEYSPTV